MSYESQIASAKFSGYAIITVGIFTLLSIVFAISEAHLKAAAILLAIGSALCLIGYLGMKSAISSIIFFKNRNYEWYKKTFPNSIVRNKVTCFHCGNNRIHVRSIFNRTYHREHFCTQCGKTLYYSPEG